MIDSLGSIALPGNNHEVWYDVERYARYALGLLLLIAGLVH